jgi:secreted trypsin-like serine protease
MNTKASGLVLATGALALATAFAASANAEGMKGPKTPLDLINDRTAAMDPSRKKIVNGDIAPPGAFPYQVSMFKAVAKKGEESSYHYCGGSLISDTWVLTAAHCVTELGEIADPKDIDVYVGSTNFKDGDRIQIKSIYRHPRYDAEFTDNDVALLKLERAPRKPVKFAKIDLIDSTKDSVLETPGTDLTVVGWGYTGDQAWPSKNLRYTRIKMVDRAECGSNIARYLAADLDDSKPMLELVRQFRIAQDKIRAVHDTIVANAGFVNDNMICAGDPNPPSGAELVQDACNGDSGGPLIAKLGGKPIQVGIVSWGEGCGRAKLYGVYTRLSNYLEWIKVTMTD